MRSNPVNSLAVPRFAPRCLPAARILALAVGLAAASAAGRIADDARLETNPGATRELERSINADRLSPNLPPSLQMSLIEAALDMRKEDATQGSRLRAATILGRDAESAAPLIASLLVAGSNGELHDEPEHFATRFHTRQATNARSGIDPYHGDSAIAAELLRLPGGREAMVDWLVAAGNTTAAAARDDTHRKLAYLAWKWQGQDVPLDGIPEEADAYLRWLEAGEPVLDSMGLTSDDDRKLYGAIYAFVTENEESARPLLADLDSPLKQAAANLVLAMSPWDAAAFKAAKATAIETIDKLPDDLTEEDRDLAAAVAALAGEADRVVELQSEVRPVETIGMLTHLGRYEEAEAAANRVQQQWQKLIERRRQGDDENGDGPSETELRFASQAWQVFRRTNLAQTNRRTYDTPLTGYYELYVRAATGDADAVRSLATLEPGEVGWQAAAAQTPELSSSIIDIATLGDPAAALNAATQMLVAQRHDDAAKLASEVALIGLTSVNGGHYYLSRASDHASRAEHHELASRLCSAQLLLMLIEPHRNAVRTWFDNGQNDPRGTTPARISETIITLLNSQIELAAGEGDLGLAKSIYDATEVFGPLEINGTIALVRAADAAGQGAMANEIFGARFAKLRERVSQYSSSPMLNNQAAWLAARCNRAQDTALSLAKRAVNTGPGRTAQIDTLAEVHLVRGEDELAMQTMINALVHSNQFALPFYAIRYDEVLRGTNLAPAEPAGQ